MVTQRTTTGRRGGRRPGAGRPKIDRNWPTVSLHLSLSEAHRDKLEGIRRARGDRSFSETLRGLIEAHK